MKSDKKKELEAFLEKVPDDLIFSAAGRRMAKYKTNPGGRPPVMRKCPLCEFVGGGRDMRLHKSSAHPGEPYSKKPAKPTGRKTILKKCPFCDEMYGVKDMRAHRAEKHKWQKVPRTKKKSK